jgi:hypothetical protein
MLPTNAVLSSTPITEGSQGTSVRSVSGFGKVLDRAAGAHAPPAQLVTQQVSTDSAIVSPARVQATGTDVLKPKFDGIGHSLSDLKQRVNNMQPSGELMRTHLQQIDSQFRLLGDKLKVANAATDPIELLRLQSSMYQLAEELEMLTRVVDQATNGVRSLLQTQL